MNQFEKETLSQMEAKRLPRLLTSKELQSYLRSGRSLAEKFGKACGAERRVGRKLLFDLETINRALEGGE